MLCRNFEPIPIKFGFFYKFFKLFQNQAKDPVLQGVWPNFVKSCSKLSTQHKYMYIYQKM